MKKRILFLFMAISIALSGCVQREEAVEQEETQQETTIEQNQTQQISQGPQSGGELRLAIRSIQTLNPLLNQDKTVDSILRLIYEPLVTIDGSYEPTANIAESWRFTEDGLSVIVNLKSGLLWHDGSEITAQDVAFSIDTIQSADDNSVYKECGEHIAGYTVTGTYDITIDFIDNFSGNIYYLSFPLISSAYYRGENVMESDKNMEPLGNSLFQVDTYVPAKELNLKQAANSFGKTAYVDTIKALVVLDKTTELYAFDQGILDAIVSSETELGKYENENETHSYEFATNYVDFIGFNFNNSILSDKNVRKAVAYCVPKDNLIESVYLSHAVAAQTPMNPSSWLYESNTKKYSYNLQGARDYLELSNWTDTNGDQVRDRTTNEYQETLSLSILVNSENTERVQIAYRMEEEMEAVGFDITVIEEPYEIYAQRLAEKNFDIFIGGWELSIVPDFSFMFSTQGSGNYISYSTEQMDTLLYAAYTAIGRDNIKSAYSQLQVYIAEELPYVTLVFRNAGLFTQTRVHGDIEPTESNRYNNIENWYILEE